MNKITFDSTSDSQIKVVASHTNPIQKHVEFVFTDFLPNKNKQGVRAAEATNLINTGVNAPVKVDFRRGKIGDHYFSVPVGPITEMRNDGDRVIASAVIWKDEFGELVDYLEKASASEDGVHFSWELYYGGKDVDDDGITWFNDVVVAGATIVANPAYAGRTPLIAMAAEDMAEKVKELERQVAAFAEQLSHNGSKQLMDPVEELKQQVADLTQQVAELKTLRETESVETSDTVDSAVSSDVDALNAELAELRQFKADVEKQQARAAVLSTRRAATKDIIPSDEFDAKSDFIADLTDDQFKSFTDTLAQAAQRAKSTASYRFSGSVIPDPMVHGGTSNITTTQELAKALRERK